MTPLIVKLHTFCFLNENSILNICNVAFVTRDVILETRMTSSRGLPQWMIGPQPQNFKAQSCTCLSISASIVVQIRRGKFSGRHGQYKFRTERILFSCITITCTLVMIRHHSKAKRTISLRNLFLHECLAELTIT